MTFKFSILFSLFFFISALSGFSIQESKNFTDANNLQQGPWEITNKTKKLPGYTEEQVVEEGYFKDGKKVGKWTTYYPNGRVQHELTYVNNKPDGLAVFYFQNGKVKEEGIWRNNRWVGAYKFYYENGKVRNEWQYTETGKRSGIQRYYHENGQLMIEGAWEEGKESGLLTEYYEDGSVKMERFYAAGTLDASSVKVFAKAEKPGPGSKPAPVEKTAPLPPKNPAPKPVVKKSVIDSLEVNESARVIIKKEDATTNQKPFDGNGYYELRNRDGKIIRKGVFQNGYLIDGQMFQYAPTGKLLKTTYFKGGKVIKVENM